LTTYEGALNFREIGGLPTTNGRRLRRGVLYRSGTPQLLSEEGARAMVDELGIRLVADLRAAQEAQSEGQGGLAAIPHRRISVPFQVAAARQEGSLVPRFATGDSLVSHYLGYLGSSVGSVLRLFRALAEPDGLPALLHCTAGKDRTGAAVILLLDALGVEREAIVEDYAAGADEIAAVFETLIALPSYGARLAALPAEARNTEPETAQRYLEALDEQFGGVHAWLRAAGLRDDELEALNDRLTEGR
jgi:protein tyrosine/serine phosphatase